MTKVIPMLAAAFLLQSCSSPPYLLLATLIDGRLAFVPEKGEEECISIIRVRTAGPQAPDPAIEAITDLVKRSDAIERARTAWAADGVSFSCKAPFPVFYGAALPDMPVIVAPKKLRVGIPYSVSTTGPEAESGEGCFRIAKNGRPENLGEHHCYDPPMAEAAAVSPPPPPGPAAAEPAQARAGLQSLIAPEDYPESALRAGEQGRVSFILDVDATGRVERCTISWSSGSPALDAATCRLMRSRARFRPARDANGNPAPGRIDHEVIWTLPGGTPPPPVVKVHTAPGGMAVSVSAPPPVIVHDSSIVHEPIMAIPQSGPGPAELSVWTRGSNQIPTLGKYESIPKCRKAMAKLKLKPGQKAYCTLAPKKYRDWGIH